MLLNLEQNIGTKKDNNMKNLLISFIVLTFIGCEPGYRIYIRNNAPTTLLIKTHPSIEFGYKLTGYYDSIISNKVSQDGKFSLYIIKPFTTFRIYDNIGGKPTSNQIPFDYVEVIRGRDTIILDSKEKIINELKKGNKKFDYYIEAVK